MSDKRRADMASIQAAIQFGVQRKQEDAQLRSAAASQLQAVLHGPVSEGEVDDTLKQAEEIKLQREKEAEEAQRLNEKYEVDALQLQKENQSLLKRNLTNAWNGFKGTINGFKGNVGRLSMPGGLALPIITLIILFMLLVPVNGHTRLNWLWLVLSGNAGLIGGEASGNFSNGKGTGGGPPPADTSNTSPSDFTSSGGGPAYTYTAYEPLEMDEW